MASRNMQINLQFNANVQNAKAQLQSLQTQLNNLINSNTASTSLGITSQIQEATRSVMDLKIALNNAMNVNTGKLNLNKFQSELNRMGKDIGYFAQQMERLGPEGVKAFTQVASAVAQADTKLFSLQGGMKKLANTFMNTVRWQLTSQAIMAVTGAISETVSYAKELDTSLNNIRIVTGKSADQMAMFAKQANNAAKALSTSTTKYTDASLIYYQQGLNDKAVKERTDVTVKLANVVGENAETVSEWMTAIWNNFDDGSESLEHYADVLAKLGAATASSADEIAGGLEKFAAVAETIGLSYEYAASALATITAETRQSEDVVGTALKTILSRMEQLKQGDTLEDGTTLGQYSLALQKVGVDIKNASGELKDMDIILEQTGTRWETLGRDQQIALAQQVAGIRQYTQFMALMDNWDVMEKNLEITEQANGALAEQQRIYEESTKAAEERMKVAGEAIKATLLSGDSMTTLYDIGAGALEIINELLEAFGGLPTILFAVATALTKVYQPQVASFLSQAALAGKDLWTNMRHPIKAMKGENITSSQQIRLDTLQAAKDANAKLNPGENPTSNKLLEAEFNAQSAIIKNENKINASAKQKMEWQIQYLNKKKEELMLIEEINIKNEEANVKNIEKLGGLGVGSNDINQLTVKGSQAGKLAANTNLLSAKVEQISHADVNTLNASDKKQLGNNLGTNLEAIKKSAGELGIELNKVSNKGFKQIEDAIDQLKNNGTVDIEVLLNKIKQLQEQLGTIQGKDSGAIGQVLNTTTDKLKTDIIQEETDKMLGGNVTDADKMFTSVDSIDTDKFSNNKFQSQDSDLLKYDGKSHKNIIKSFKEQAKSLKDQKKLLLEQQQGLDKSSKKYQSLQKKIKDNKKATSQLGKEMTKFKKNLNSTTAINEDYGKTIDDTTKSSQDLANGTEVVNEGFEDVKQGFENVEEAADNGGAGFVHWTDSLAAGVQGLSQYLMGLSMLNSAFSQIGMAIAGSDEGLSGWISNLSSMLMGIMMVIPGIQAMNKSTGELAIKIGQEMLARKMNKIAMQAEKQQGEQGLITKKKEQQEEDKVVQKKKVSIIHKIFSAFAGIAEDAGKGVPGWIEAAASLAMVAPIALMIGASVISGISGAKQQNKEEKQEEVSKATETLETINENQELAESVSDLTEEYKELRASGESTAEVLEEMNEKIPELIDNYKELAKTMGTSLDTTSLEDAYEYFKLTGDISKYESAQEKVDEQVADSASATAKGSLSSAVDLVFDAAMEDDGHNGGLFGWSGNYSIDVIDNSDDDERNKLNTIMKKSFGDTYDEDGDQVKFDEHDAAAWIDYYDSLGEAIAEMQAQGLDDTETYERLVKEYSSLEESMSDLKELADAIYQDEKKSLLKETDEGLGKLVNKDIDSLSEYRDQRADIINAVKKQHSDWTEAQIEDYLKSTKAFGDWEKAIETFGTDLENSTELSNKITQAFGLSGQNATESAKQALDEVYKYYDNLTEEEKTLFMYIDFTTANLSMDNLDGQLDALMEEARQKMRIAAAKEEAISLEADEKVFETYAEILQQTNEHLADNEAAAYEVAAANYRVKKGIDDLNSTWEKSIKKMREAEVGSYEYAEGLSEITEAVRTLLGNDNISAAFVSQNLDAIEQVLNGSEEAFEELQTKAAKTYIEQLGIMEETIPGMADAIPVDEITNAFNSIFEQMSNIEVGEGAEISQDYLNTLQKALEAGQITEEQLKEIFKLKGFSIDYKYETVPGPTTHYKRTYFGNSWFDGITVEWDESSEMQVPLIGDSTVTSSGKDGSSSTSVTKVSGGDSISGLSTTSENAEEAKKRVDDLKDEADRYHEINEIISDTERELDRLGKAKDRAFGPAKLALMKDEIDKQKELIRNNEELLKQAQGYAAADKKDLIANTASSLSIQFDEYGRIANYEDLQAAYIKRLEKNAGNESLYKDIEEEYKAFKDAAERYEESLNKVEEQAETLNDQLDELYSKNLEKIEYNVQIKVDVADDDKAYIDFLMQKVEDDAFAAAKAIDYLGQQATIINAKIEANQQGITDIQNAVANGEITPEQGAEKLREYRDELIDLNADLLEVRQTVQDKLTEAFEAWNEKIEEGTSKLEFYSSVLEGYKNIIDIVGKDMLGISDETMNKLNQTIISNANDSIRATKAQLDANKATLENMKRAREEARDRGDKEAVKEWDEQIKVAEEKVQELTTTLQDKLSTGLEAVATAFGDTVNQIAENFSKAVSGVYDSIEAMREGWDRQQEVADRFLDAYEQTYELNKLNRQIQNSIDKTDNVGSQKELRDLQQEIYEMTKDGQQLSKYDLEYLQKKYDLMVAEQALKDAQNAKSVVRLQRDSEGNFGYVYTADQNNVDSAQQNYEDKLFAFQQYTTKMDEELTEMYITVQEQAYERMQAAAEMYGEGTEAFERERQKILEQYNIDMGYITDEYENLTKRNLDINQKFNAGVAETYEETFINSIAPQYQSFEQLYNETTTQCETSCTRLDEAITLLQQTFDKQLELAGQDLEGFEKTANTELEKVQGDSSTTADEVEIMADDMDDALNGPDGAISKVEAFQLSYFTEMEKVWGETDKVIKKVQELITQYGELAEAAGTDYTPESGGAETVGGSGATTTSENDSQGITDIVNTSDNLEKFAVQDIVVGSKGTEYKVNGSWYTLDELNAPNQGHTKKNDEVSIKSSASGETKGLDTIKVPEFNWHYTNIYDKNGKKTGSAYSGGPLEIDAVSTKLVNDMRLYHWKYTGSDKSYVQEGYINQTDLNQILGNDKTTQLYKKHNLKQFDTGGYTGDWGPDGRLAMLHQKEIVLNAHDTENFLAAIGIVRDISDQIEKNAIVMQYQNQLANYRASVGNGNDTLQQEVHITAEFPNATDHNEIEEAFKNLTNLASQYANRKS